MRSFIPKIRHVLSSNGQWCFRKTSPFNIPPSHKPNNWLYGKAVRAPCPWAWWTSAEWWHWWDRQELIQHIQPVPQCCAREGTAGVLYPKTNQTCSWSEEFHDFLPGSATPQMLRLSYSILVLSFWMPAEIGKCGDGCKYIKPLYLQSESLKMGEVSRQVNLTAYWCWQHRSCYSQSHAPSFWPHRRCSATCKEVNKRDSWGLWFHRNSRENVHACQVEKD